MSESNTNKTQAESSKLKTCLTACGNRVKKHKSLTALTLSVLLGLGLALTIGRKPLGEKLGSGPVRPINWDFMARLPRPPVYWSNRPGSPLRQPGPMERSI